MDIVRRKLILITIGTLRVERSKTSHFQNEAKCKTCLVKMSFIYMRIKTTKKKILLALHIALL